MRQKLKPCPFCGSEAKLKEDEFGDYYILCISITCFGMMTAIDSRANLIRRWNRRAGEGK